ncbi:MAG: MgtC/SapB family protein [Candidatus Gracilibacteria bacterium]|nr:MgtC/SapB family protein [Candidatus Gracilibacteria bacterium]
MEPIITSLFISLSLGAFIGLQFRKKAEEGDYQDHSFAGMRTCMGITILGYLSVFLSQYDQSIFLLFSSFFLLLVLISYVQSAFQEKRIGGTDEITLATLFMVGILIGHGETSIAIVLTIILSIISSGRDELYKISSKFTKLEVIETVKFAIIIFLILPLLPNETIDPWGIFNPHTIWVMVILISGIGFMGYMASKFVGKGKGILLSGFIGGFVSSTAVTTEMAIESKKNKRYINVYSIAIMLSSLMMYIRVLIEASLFNKALLSRLIIPIGGMTITMLFFTLYNFYTKKGKKTPILKKDIQVETPFSLGPAIKFSLFFVIILGITELAKNYLGSSGIYIASIFSGFADVDAITISLSQLSSETEILEQTAIRGITYAVISNTIIKLIYVHIFGSKEMRQKLMVVVTSSSVVGILLSFLI